MDGVLVLAPLAAPVAVAAVARAHSEWTPRFAFFVSILASSWLVGWSAPRAHPARAVFDIAASTALVWLAAVAIAGQSEVDAVYFSLFAASALLIGRLAAAYQSRLDARRVELRTAEAERAARIERVAAAARESIAVELRDVVGQSVGVMTLQAGAARLTLESGDLEAAREALLAVEKAGHAALVDLRRMLGVLRTDMAEAS